MERENAGSVRDLNTYLIVFICQLTVQIIHQANDGARSVYLYGPATVLILSNVVFFIMTILIIHRSRVDAAFTVSSQQARQK